MGKKRGKQEHRSAEIAGNFLIILVGVFHVHYIMVYYYIWNWLMKNEMENLQKLRPWTEREDAFISGLKITLGFMLAIVVFNIITTLNDKMNNWIIRYLHNMADLCKDTFFNIMNKKKTIFISVVSFFKWFIWMSWGVFRIKYLVLYIIIWVFAKFGSDSLYSYMIFNPEKISKIYYLGFFGVGIYMLCSFIYYHLINAYLRKSKEVKQENHREKTRIFLFNKQKNKSNDLDWW